MFISCSDFIGSEWVWFLLLSSCIANLLLALRLGVRS